ncbi:MAG: TRAP transporter small permease [Pseudomonadota bacterium]
MLRAIDRLADIGAGVAAWLFVMIGGMITFEVVGRYGFTAPTIWAEELSRFCQVWAVYLGAAYVLRRGHLIRITFVTDRLGRRWRQAAEAFSLLAIMVIAAIALWWGMLITIESLAIGRITTSMLGTPLWMSEIAIPIGAALLLLQSLALLIRLTRGEPS